MYAPFCEKALAQRTIIPDQHFIAQKAAMDMLLQLKAMGRDFSKVLILNDPCGTLHKHFPQAQTYGAVHRSLLPFEGEAFDLVIDCMSWHWINDLPQALMEIKRILSPEGLMLAGFLGEKTLTELRQTFLEQDLKVFQGAAQRIAPMAQAQTLGELMLSCGFKDPILDLKSLSVHYANLRGLLNDMRFMGERGYLYRPEPLPPLNRFYYQGLEDLYGQRFKTPDGKLPATFDLIYVLGRG